MRNDRAQKRTHNTHGGDPLKSLAQAIWTGFCFNHTVGILSERSGKSSGQSVRSEKRKI